MKSTSVTNLKARLSAYLRTVKLGESVIVTEHGHPVAQLVPAEPLQTAYEELVRSGLVRPAAEKLTESFWKRLPGKELKRARVLDSLLEEREAGR